MKRVLIAATTLLFSLSAALAGCTKAPATSDNAKESASPAPSAAASPTGSNAKKYKGEIVISLWTDPASHQETGFSALAEAYKKVQPDVKLVWEPSGASNAADYEKWLGTQLASGTPRADIVSSNYQPSYTKYVNFDKYRKKTNPYTGNAWDQDLNFDFYAFRNSKGERTLLPTQAVHIMWYYNKEIFDKLGLQPPKTWDELVQVAEKIQAAGITPIATNYAWKLSQWLPEIYLDQYTRNWHDIVRAHKGDYNYDESLDGIFKADLKDPNIDLKYNYNASRMYKAIKDGQIRFDTPQFTTWVANMAKVFPKYAQKDVLVTNDSSDYTLWLQQKAAIMIDGTWSLPTITDDMKKLNDPKRLEELKIKDSGALKPFSWGIFDNPAMGDSLVQGPVRSIESASGEYVGIVDKNQEQTDMVADFVMFWLSKGGYQAWIDGQVKAGTLKLSGPVMVKDVKLPEETSRLFDQLKMMGNAEIVMNQVLSMVLAVKDLQTEAKNDLKEALEGKMTPDEFGKKIQAMYAGNLNQIVSKAGLSPDGIDHPEKAPGK